MSSQDEEWERLERDEDDDFEPLTEVEIEDLRADEREAERWRQEGLGTTDPRSNDTGGQS